MTERFRSDERLHDNPQRWHEEAWDNSAPRMNLPVWYCAVAVEIVNFVMLRRQLGLARVQTLANAVAARIEEEFSDIVAASAGHNLIELRFASETRDRIDHVLKTISTKFEQPIDLYGEQCQIELALGGARCDSEEGADVCLIEEAEHALRDARDERAPVIRDVPLSGTTIDRIALASDLVLAIERGELLLEYQPKVHLRRQEVRSVEALVRWRHPVRGMVYPGDFIPLAEESRLIVGLTLWTLRQAIIDQRTLSSRGHDLTVFVNISGVLLGDARFVDLACQLIEGCETKIGFEITETAVIRDPEGAIANLKLFAGIGVTLAIDDYGAGLSSLAYLKQLPARELKIDKLFVTKLTSSNRDPLIVRSTIDLAHALEMEVVAEGVETLAALALLSVMGCDMAQGYLISRPIALYALISFLDDQRHLELVQDMTSPFKLILGTTRNG